jgi:hypothetical protein
MSIELNHIISPARSKWASGRGAPDDKLLAIAPDHPVVGITDAR